MLGALSDKFESALRQLSGKAQISERNVRDAMDDVRTALLEADVHYEVAESFCAKVLQEALGTKVLSAIEPGQQMIKIVHDELVRLLGGDEAVDDVEKGLGIGEGSDGGIMFVSPGPTIVMMSGLQGSGKTTTCGKLAAMLKKQGKTVMLAAADLQRPAAVLQLQVLAQQVEADASLGKGGRVLFHGEPERCAEYGKAVGVAVEVCKNALKKAQSDKADVLILDTAGRLHINDELMGELRKVNAALQPHHIFLVLDAMTGQDAVNSAKAFNQQLELDGIILTKFDSDTRGGAALSVREVTGKPIKFIGTGEKLDAIEPFHPTRIAGRILGMGDVVSLVEKAQQEVSEEEALAISEKLATGKLTMDDFLKQLRAMRRMGSMKSLLGLLPGVGSQLKDLPMDERDIDRTEAIINSMSVDERKDIDLLDNSRRRRISRGSGTGQQDVSQLVKGFGMVSQLGQAMSGLGMLGKVKAMSQMNPAALQGLMSGKNALGSLKNNKPDKPKYKERKKRR